MVFSNSIPWVSFSHTLVAWSLPSVHPLQPNHLGKDFIAYSQALACKIMHKELLKWGIGGITRYSFLWESEVFLHGFFFILDLLNPKSNKNKNKCIYFIVLLKPKTNNNKYKCSSSISHSYLYYQNFAPSLLWSKLMPCRWGKPHQEWYLGAQINNPLTSPMN